MLDALLEVRSARMRTSSTDMPGLSGVTPLTGSSRAAPAARSSMMRDLSRWMWVSIRPGQARRPGVVDLALGGKPALDRDDPAFLDADIQRTVGRTIGQPRIADDQIHALTRP